MKITPHHGLGDIPLGISRGMVLRLLGQPDEKDAETFADGSEIEYFEYNSPAVSLGFSSVDGDKLGTITIRSEEATLEGRRVVGVPIDELLENCPGLVLDDDFEENGQDYVDDARGLSFWVSDGIVDNVTVFPDWIDDETPRWPETRITEQVSGGNGGQRP
ncbi:MAG: hypothetical protein R3F19_07350 [Verrucomicrobiales bacterium]